MSIEICLQLKTIGAKLLIVSLLAASCLLAVSGKNEKLARDYNQPTNQYLRDSWGTEKGLPQSSVTAVVQTSDGYIWVGTFGGLARFDGINFTVFDTGNTESLKSSRILALSHCGSALTAAV